ncbi:MAG TPA: hypothetical protein VJH70_02225 [Candidatus Paceibacterota bacterium]
MKKLFIILGTFFLFGTVLGNTVFAAAYFNTDPQDYPTLQVTNFSDNPTCTGCWSSTVSANPGDVVSFLIYYHNTSNETATQTKVRASLPGSSGTYHNISADAWAINSSLARGNTTVTTNGNATLTFLPDSVKWYPNRNTSQQSLSNANSLVTSNGVLIGDIASGWEAQGYITFRAQVNSVGSPNPPTNNPPSQPTNNLAPTVNTLVPSSVSPTSALLDGSVNPNSLQPGATVWFEYGTDSSVTNRTSNRILYGNTAFTTNEFVSNLQPNTFYYFRIAASNSSGTNYGSLMTFATPSQSSAPAPSAPVYYSSPAPSYYSYYSPPPTYYSPSTYYQPPSFVYQSPIVTTVPASLVTSNFASLNGTVTSDFGPIDVWFEFGETTTLTNSTPTQRFSTGTSFREFYSTLSTLKSNTTYYFRAAARNTYGVSYGALLHFVTTNAPIAPSISYAPPVVRAASRAVQITLAAKTNPETIAVGDLMTYELTYRNNFQSSVHNAMLYIALPPELEYQNSTIIPDVFDNNNQVIRYSLETISGNIERTISIQAKVISAPDIEGPVSIIANLPYLTTAENQEIARLETSFTITGSNLLALLGDLPLWLLFLLIVTGIGSWIYFWLKPKEEKKKSLL